MALLLDVNKSEKEKLNENKTLKKLYETITNENYLRKMFHKFFQIILYRVVN